MPTYEYACETCGHRFERFQQMSDAPLRQCPECGAKANRELSVFSAAAAAPSAGDIPPSCQSCGMDPMNCPSRM